MHALGKAFPAAQFGKAVFAVQAVEHDMVLVLGIEMPPGLASNVLHHPLGGGLR